MRMGKARQGLVEARQGAAEGRLFAAEGARVYLTDVLVAEGTATAATIGPAATFLEHDVTSEQAWTTIVGGIVAEHGRIDILVNNAGIFRVVPLTATELDLWNQVIAINQTGVFLGMRAVAPSMIARRSGSIVNISSIAGLRGAGTAFAYGASKWAVRGMTRGVAKELAPFGVRVNSIHPGIIDTPMLQTFDAAGEGVRDMVRTRIPLGYEAEPIHVARLALYLASDDSAYSTGSEFKVDGGWSA